MSTPLTAQQIRVLVDLADAEHDRTWQANAEQFATLWDLRARRLVDYQFRTPGRWVLTPAGRRAAVLAQSDEVIRT